MRPAAPLKRIAALAVAIAILSLFLGGVTYSSYQHGQFEETTRMEVQDTFGSGEYAALSLVDVQVTYARTPSPIAPPDRVVLTVGRPGGTTYPDLAATLKREISAATGYDVAVQVRFVEIQSAGGDVTPATDATAALVRPTRGSSAAG